MAPDSNTAIGSPPPMGSSSTKRGIRWLGFCARKLGLNWTPRPMLKGTMRCSSAASSKNIVIFLPFGVGQKWTWSMVYLVGRETLGAGLVKRPAGASSHEGAVAPIVGLREVRDRQRHADGEDHGVQHPCRHPARESHPEEPAESGAES